MGCIVIQCHLIPPFKIKSCSSVFICPPPPPPPPPPPANNHQANTLLLLSLIATVTLVGVVVMLCLLFKKLIDRRRNSSRNRPALFDVREQSFSERPTFDHHIWLINTVGFQQSVIDSISLFKYKKDENLIDGSDCSICLGEFQEDESLRLLPKCSHAFHVPCIDTWLRSHKNCPLCRAPVMSDPVVEPVAAETEEESRVSELENFQIVNQNLVDDLENEGPASRRSVSLDGEEGSSSSSMAISISGSKCVEFEIENVGIGNQGLCNLVKSVSFGRFVTKGAVSMKRFSSGRRKLKGIRHYRSQSSVLPLSKNDKDSSFFKVVIS